MSRLTYAHREHLCTCDRIADSSHSDGELKAKTQLVKDFSKDLDDTEVEAALSNYVAAKPEIQDTIRAKSRESQVIALNIIRPGLKKILKRLQVMLRAISS